MLSGRVLAIDYGEKNLGLALSDSLGLVAQPAERIIRKDLDSDLERILDLVEKYKVERIVLGLPKNMDGSIGPKAKEVENFANQLKDVLSKRGLSLPVIFWDERLTTKEAEKFLVSANLSRKKRKDVRDQIAACLILQNYLQREKTNQ